MNLLSHSPFLQALGYAIANSLWQVALLWIAVVLFTGIIKFSSSARYKIALYAQFAGFIWFLITLQFYYTQCSAELIQSEALSSSAKTFSSVNNYSFLLNSMLKAEQLLPYLSFAYLCLLIFLTARLLKNYRFAQLIKTTDLQKADVQLKLFVKKISSLLNIKADVKIYLSNFIKSPLTIGFLKPVILIPVASINNLTTEQLEAVILHELAHIRRADYLINLLQCVMETGLFFNPFTQLLSRIIKKERENCCDDWVLQFQYQPEVYADALLRIACFQTKAGLALQAQGQKGDLLSRVKRMINKNEKTFNYRQQLIALVLMTFILSSFTWFQPSAKNNIQVSKISKEQKAPLPVIVKVDNPLFNPAAIFLSKSAKKDFEKISTDNFSNENMEDENFQDAISTEHKGIFTKIISPAFDAIKKINFNEIIQNAFKTSEDSLQKLTVCNEDNFVENKDLTDFVDTATIAASLREAAENLKNVNFTFINENIQKAREQLQEECKKNKTEEILKTIKIKGNAAIELAKMTAQQKQEEVQQEMNKILLKNKTDKDKFILLMKQLRDQKQKMDSLQEETNIYSKNNQNWQISYPVYVEKPNLNHVNYSYAISAKDDNDEENNSIISVTENNEAAASNVSINTCEKPKIKITRSENAQSVNITIEIL